MSRVETLDEVDQLTAGVAQARGDAFFPAVARCIAGMLKASRALVSETVDDTHVHTLGVFADGSPCPNYPYALAGVPCEKVIAGETIHLERADGGRPAYFGLPLHGEDGTVLGHLCATDDGALLVSPRQRVLCEMLAACASAELQRRVTGRQLEELLRRHALLEARNRHLEDELRLLEREQIAAAGGASRASTPDPSTPLDENEITGLHHVQREHILRVLNATHWVIEGNSGAALKLGMKPATLRHRMKKLGISRAQNAPAH
jgi:GAF domain-containing protein